MLQTEHLFLFAFCVLTAALLLGMLLSSHRPPRESPSKKPKGYCPLCGHTLYAGEKVRSNQEEIGDIEVRTRIKGCVYCINPENKMPRSCPVCKKDVPLGEAIFAASNPRQDRLKLKIKGCQSCFPQGF